VMRKDVPLVRLEDDLAHVLDIFAAHDTSRLCVGLNSSPGRVVGFISRSTLLGTYRDSLSKQG